MLDPGAGPFLFDTSAESWLGRGQRPDAAGWMRAYLAHHPICVSSITVVERIRGYALLWRRATTVRDRERIETARLAYLSRAARVFPLDEATGVVTGELLALAPEPPTPPRRTHRLREGRPERLARWRFDQMIAATALVTGLRLIHNNAADFELLRLAVERSPERFPGLGALELTRCTALI